MFTKIAIVSTFVAFSVLGADARSDELRV